MGTGLFALCLAGVPVVSAQSLTVSGRSNTNALDASECYAPTEEGGWGYCGAPTCRNKYITCSGEGGGPPRARMTRAPGHQHKRQRKLERTRLDGLPSPSPPSPPL